MILVTYTKHLMEVQQLIFDTVVTSGVLCYPLNYASYMNH